MYATHCTAEQLMDALRKINETYAGNIEFKEGINRTRKGLSFRLKSHDSNEPGASASSQGRKTGSGCWHVHGDFFDTLFSINSQAVIHSRGQKITERYGNWEDTNVGSNANPCYASDACDCDFSKELTGKLSTQSEIIKAIQSKDFFSLMSDHGYRYGKLILESSPLSTMNQEQIQRLMDSWGDKHGKIILKHCSKNLLPLYLNVNNDLKTIVEKRLKLRKAA